MRQSVRIVAMVTCLSMCAVLLASCSGISRPFSRSKTWLTNREPVAPPVTISQLSGAPDASVAQLASHVYTESKRRGFTTTMKGEASKTFSMTGHVSAAPSAKGTTVVYVWDVVDPSGEHKTRITGDETIPGAGFNDPWNAVDDSAMQRIASRTAEELSSFISKMGCEVKLASVPPPAAMLSDTADSIQTADITGNPTVAEADPVVTGTVAPANDRTAPPAQPQNAKRTASVAKPAAKEPVKKAQAKTKSKKKPTKAKANAIAVPMVVGARGRGNQELAAAMRKAMSRAGVPIVKKQRKGAITVAGEVKLDPPAGSVQTVSLNWKVIDHNGTVIGTIAQKNQVPAGSLDSSWGSSAGYAANAAAGGIFKLLSRIQ